MTKFEFQFFTPPLSEGGTKKMKILRITHWPLYIKNLASYGNFVGQVTTKSHNLKIFKSQYLSEFLRYRLDFLHVIMNFIGLKITFSNMGSHGALSLISGGWPKKPPPPFSWESETSPLIGLSLFFFQFKDHFIS